MLSSPCLHRPSGCYQNDRSAQRLGCWLSSYCLSQFQFHRHDNPHKSLSQPMRLCEGVRGMSFVLARSTDWRGPDSALGWLLLSFLCASRVFLFSPPLTQKLFSEKHLISAEFGPERSGIALARAFCVSLAFWQACLWRLPELWGPWDAAGGILSVEPSQSPGEGGQILSYNLM